MFTYEKASPKELVEMFEWKASTLKHPEYNAMVSLKMNGEFYLILYEHKKIGYFSISEKKILTQFFILKSWANLSHHCFQDILKSFHIEEAYVLTSDEAFLVMCLDFHDKVKTMAYIFEETDKVVQLPAFKMDYLRLALYSDLENIKNLTGDFFKNTAQKITERKIYILEVKGEIYGLGTINDSIIPSEYMNIRVFTIINHRHKGVARSIILHLRDLAHTVEKTTLPICLSQNYSGKRVFESCGYISKVRWLNVIF